jgi:hypothetical protein
MAYPIPKIIYGSTTLAFTFPPVQKPLLDDREAVRHDSITTSGLRQSALERVDIIKHLQMEYVPWADLTAWAAFIDYAIQGGEFSYYLDASLSAFQTFELVDSSFAPTYNSRGLTKFTLKLRLVPGGASSA